MDMRYVERVQFQSFLDQLFPLGAWLTITDVAGVPSGVEIITGRLFCVDARMVEGVWEFEVFADPRDVEISEVEYVRPFRWWTRDISVVESDPDGELYDSWAIDGEVGTDTEQNRVRLDSRPQGPRVIPAGLREFVTALREAELFPQGLELENV